MNSGNVSSLASDFVTKVVNGLAGGNSSKGTGTEFKGIVEAEAEMGALSRENDALDT